MNKLVLLLLAALAVGAVAHFKEGGSFADDEKALEDNHKCLFDGGDSDPDSDSDGTGEDDGDDTNEDGSGGDDDDDDGASSGDDDNTGEDSNEGSGGSGGPGKYCLILQYFYKLAIQFEGTAVYELWLQWIEEIHVTIVLDTQLTSQEKLCALWARLEVFISVHVEIRETVYYLYIEEWGGYVRDLEAVSVSFNSQVSETIVTLDGDSCELFDALRNATSGELADLIEELIAELLLILKDGSISYSYKLVLIYEKFQAFCEAHAEFKEELLAIEITGYGVVGSFYEVCGYYWAIYNANIAVGGSTDSCAILATLQACYQNSATGSASQRAQIKALYTKLQVYFEANVDIEVRVSYLVAQFYELFILNEWSISIVYELDIAGYGSIYRLLYALALQKNCGIDFTAPVATTEELSSSTSAPNGDCGDVLSVFDFSDNTTLLLSAIDEAQQSWNSTQIQRFATYKKRIYTVSANTTATVVERYESVVKVLNGWTTNTYYLELVYSIFISVWGGDLKQVCGCESAVQGA